MNHDDEWLHSEDEKRRHLNAAAMQGQTEAEHFEGIFDFCRRYHEHMTKGDAEFDSQIYKAQEDAKVRYEQRIVELEAENERLSQLYIKSLAGKE